MKSFVLMFRQGRTLTELELNNRAEATRAWAQSQNAAGHQLDPRILMPESHWVPLDHDSVRTNTADRVSAVLFIVARDAGQAIEIAKAHPARAYGATIEVREWSAPAPPAAP